MTRIKNLTDQIQEELEGAKGYAENYVEYKVKGNSTMANRYKEMANDELKHAGYIHDEAVQAISELEKNITPPAEMLEKWRSAHKNYVDNAAWVKQMLTL